ncbi:MAG TPA: hypothetical protein ENO09_06680 [bacterium]|nr:hypothetical protein [bacterium]
MNTPKSTASDDEMLSALADGALSGDEVRKVFSRLNTAPRGAQHDAARRLERYALLGELMRAEADSPLFSALAQHHASGERPRDVVGAVMQHIATDTMPTQSTRSVPVAQKPDFWHGWLEGWRAPAFSMALAASVAVVMLVVVQDAGVNVGEPVLSAQRTAPVLNVQRSALPDLTETAPSLATLEAPADALPDAYLLQHLAHAEGGAVRNLSSNVRLASYERP